MFKGLMPQYLPPFPIKLYNYQLPGCVMNSISMEKLLMANKRITAATYNGNSSTMIIVNYAPQEGTEHAIEYMKFFQTQSTKCQNITFFWYVVTLTRTSAKMNAHSPIMKRLTVTVNFFLLLTYSSYSSYFEKQKKI